MIVVDSNVLAYLYLPRQQRKPCWKASPIGPHPLLWRSEFRNILAGYLRQGSLTFPQAYSVQYEAENLLSGAEYEVDSLSVLELVRDSECSAYDCEFVALAMKLGTKLATMDGKLLRGFPGIAVALTAG